MCSESLFVNWFLRTVWGDRGTDTEKNLPEVSTSSSVFQETTVNTHERLTLPDKFAGLPGLSSQYEARVSTGLVQPVQLYKLGALTNHVIQL